MTTFTNIQPAQAVPSVLHWEPVPAINVGFFEWKGRHQSVNEFARSGETFSSREQAQRAAQLVSSGPGVGAISVRDVGDGVFQLSRLAFRGAALDLEQHASNPRELESWLWMHGRHATWVDGSVVARNETDFMVPRVTIEPIAQ